MAALSFVFRLPGPLSSIGLFLLRRRDSRGAAAAGDPGLPRIFVNMDRRSWVVVAVLVYRVALVELGHPGTCSPDLSQVHIDLLPPRPPEFVVLECHVTVPCGRVERGRSDRARVELQTQDGVHGVIDERPRRVAQVLVLLEAEEANELVEDAVGLFQLQVEAERLEEQVLIVENRVSPLPELLGLLVHDEVGLLLRDPAACDDKLLHLPAVLLHLRGQEERRSRDRIWMHSRSLWQVHHAEPHEEPVQVHGRCRKSELRQLQHDPHLRYEVDPLAPAREFRLHRHAIQLGWRPCELFIREDPLRLRLEEDGI